MTDLSNRVAVVTGAASGIGAAMVRTFVEAGARVGFCDVDGARGEALARELGAAALFVSADVSQRAQVDAFVASVAAQFKCIDILVNNAGITHDGTDFGALDFRVWRRVFDVNLDGMFFMIQAALPHMGERSAIINVGSILAEALFPGKTAYAASKAAVAAFSKALALDLAPRGIRVNCLIPGSVDTDMMWRGVSAEDKLQAESNAGAEVPLGRVGAPGELAAVAAFLASGAASYVTGTSVLVDGGLLARIAARR
jgi:NAD(P)-dependent dehydrogenase (short-subunit alcohol dehydrogenase family)